MKTINTNIHRHFRFAATILTMGYLAVAGSAYAKDKVVPFKGYFIGGSIGDDLNPATATQVGTGNCSHLGKYSFVSVIQVAGLFFPKDFDLETGLYLVCLDGTTTFTTANGDQLVTTDFIEGWFDFAHNNFVRFSSENEITDGTGRFDGASGCFESDGIVTFNFDPDEFDVTEAWFDGWISTVGSRGGNGKK